MQKGFENAHFCFVISWKRNTSKMSMTAGTWWACVRRASTEHCHSSLPWKRWCLSVCLPLPEVSTCTHCPSFRITMSTGQTHGCFALTCGVYLQWDSPRLLCIVYGKEECQRRHRYFFHSIHSAPHSRFVSINTFLSALNASTFRFFNWGAEVMWVT